MWNPESYTIAAQLFPRLLGLIYFFAIGAFLFQIQGLLCKNGILPIEDYLNYFRFRNPLKKRLLFIPSFFWINASDWAIKGSLYFGTFLSLALMAGYYPSLCLGLLFLLYLSLVTTGQDFLSFGWESLLLEITFYTFWMSLTPVPNLMVWMCLNLLMFRFFIQAGAVKLQSGDIAWRNLTALGFHYQSQPLPNTWAWYASRLPRSLHQLSTLFMFFVELIVPFGLFLTDTIRAAAGVIFISLQIIIWLTGNFSYLNHLTVAFAIIAFSNPYLTWIENPPEIVSSSSIWDPFLSLIGSVFILLQLIRLWNHFQPHQAILNRWLQHLSFFHLVNRYGLFAIMTKKREEIVIEGSADGEIWKEYLFKYKPSEVTRRPRRISPYQPRLDWQVWFLPFVDFESENWFHRFLYHLLLGTPEVVKLLRYNPFPDTPPKYIRVLMYDYQFSTPEQKKEKGWWWQRELIGDYSPILKLTREEDTL